MTIDWNDQLWRYFDAADDLSSDDWQSLQQWLASDRANLKRFQEFALLHDQLRGVLLAQVSVDDCKEPELAAPSEWPPTVRPHTRRRLLSVAAVAASIAMLWLVWRGSDSAQAAKLSLGV